MNQLFKFLSILGLLMVAVCLGIVQGCDSNLNEKPETEQEAPRSLKRTGRPHHVVYGESVKDSIRRNKHSFKHYTIDAWENSFEYIGSDSIVTPENPDNRGFRRDYDDKVD